MAVAPELGHQVRRRFGVAALVALSVASAGAAEPLRLMPFGDSRVAGDPPVHDTWRYPLAQTFAETGCQIDMVGPLDGPDYGPAYDDDHASVGGFTTDDILDALPGVLEDMDAPDIAILAIGGNDLLRGDDPDEILARLNEIIEILQSTNPGLAILLEQIPPGEPALMTALQDRFDAFNSGVGMLASASNTPDARVIAVDARKGWISAKMLIDNVHYNLVGAQHVAHRYWTALQTDLRLC